MHNDKLDIRLRTATSNDIPALLEFEQGVIEAERPCNANLKPGKIHYYDIPTLIAADNAELLVAEGEGQLLGCGYARIETAKPFLKYPRHAYLGFMYVVPRYRNLGINRRIIEALGEWSAGHGAHELVLEVYAENQAAVRAYKNAGFNTLKFEMHLGLAVAGRN